MKRFVILITIIVSCSGPMQQGLLSPDQLTCEYMHQPAVVDVPNPRLAWVNRASGNERGQKQTAFQVRVATDIDLLSRPDLWDSYKVLSEQSNRVKYEGKSLESRTECWWQVRVWDKNDQQSDWSEPAFWRMGLLEAGDWKAEWIGAPWDGEAHFVRPDYPGQKFDEFGDPAPMLRKSFRIEKEVAHAVAFVTGLGYFEFYVNGNKIGDDVLIPNNTNYGKRPLLGGMYINVPDNFKEYKVMYLAYDITDNLREGENAIGSILGNGFYNPRMFWCEGYGTPRFIGQIHVTYTDGSEDVIVSDKSWKASKSPLLKNMVYYGETYDARQEQVGWSTPSFDATKWISVVNKEAPFGSLKAHAAPTDKVMERIKPKEIKRLENGNYFVDFGKEISGWVRLNNVEAPEGHQIDISFNANQYSGDNTYIFKGNGPENYAPRFNWFVFSGIEIKNWYGQLKPEHLTAEAVNTFVEPSASFETSNPLINQITEIWKRSQLDNMHGGIASDCPHRERNGYTGDGQVACAMVMHNFETRAFYQKWIQDMIGAQNPETGYVPNGAPWQPGCGGGVAWGAAICIMPWEFYKHYGARDMLEDSYEAMKEYVRYMQSWVDEDGIMFSQRRNNSGEVLKWYNLGEWVAPGETVPDDLVHTFYYWRCVDIVSKVGAVLGYSADEKKYEELAESTRGAFHNKFYDLDLETYGNGGGNVLALRMGVPESRRSKVILALKANIIANGGHFDTGIFGTRFFFEVLAQNGMQELAYEALAKTDEPSFGHWIELGSTTTREKWNEEGSHNHPMFGGGLVWLYKYLAGMQVDPANAGYKHIIFKPMPVKDLSFVNYSLHTPNGLSEIKWSKTTEEFNMQVTVPVGSCATVYIPSDKGSVVTESGIDLFKQRDLSNIEVLGEFTVCSVESGSYGFNVR